MFRFVVFIYCHALIYVGLTVSMQILSLELGVLRGLITTVHSLINAEFEFACLSG